MRTTTKKPTFALLTAEKATDLTDADERSLRAALLGANPAGLFKLPK